MEPKRLSRRELYDLVWSKPITKVAGELGLSDVGLKKICLKHRIPVPGRGHWRKLETGKRTKCALLRIINDSDLDNIVIRGSLEKQLPPAIRDARQRARIEEENPERRIIVSREPLILHPAVHRTSTALRQRKGREIDNQWLARRGHFRVDISHQAIDRTVRILDALARGAVDRGYELADSDGGIGFVVDGQTIGFRLVERSESSVAAGSDDAPDVRRLVLQLDDHYHRGLRRSWADGRRQRLEDLLNDVFAGVAAYTAAQKARSDEHARWQREWEEGERRLAAEKRHRDLEETRAKFLKERIDALEEAERIERHVQYLRSAAREAGQSAAVKVTRMLDWALARASCLRLFASPNAIALDLTERDIFAPKPDPG